MSQIEHLTESLRTINMEYDSLTRIEHLLNIDGSSSIAINHRLDYVLLKLTEYIAHTKSMLHECLLTLAGNVMYTDDNEQMQDDPAEDEFDQMDEDVISTEDEDEDDDDDKENDSDSYTEPNSDSGVDCL